MPVVGTHTFVTLSTQPSSGNPSTTTQNLSTLGEGSLRPLGDQTLTCRLSPRPPSSPLLLPPRRTTRGPYTLLSVGGSVSLTLDGISESRRQGPLRTDTPPAGEVHASGPSIFSPGFLLDSPLRLLLPRPERSRHGTQKIFLVP